MNATRFRIPAAALLVLGATVAGTAQQPPVGRPVPTRPQPAPVDGARSAHSQPEPDAPESLLFSVRHVELAPDAPADLVNRLRHAAASSRSLAPIDDAPAFDALSAALDAPGMTSWTWSASTPVLENSNAKVQETSSSAFVQLHGQGPVMPGRETGHIVNIRVFKAPAGRGVDLEFSASRPLGPAAEGRTRSLQTSTTCILPGNHTGVISLSTPNAEPSAGGNTWSFLIFTLR